MQTNFEKLTTKDIKWIADEVQNSKCHDFEKLGIPRANFKKIRIDDSSEKIIYSEISDSIRSVVIDCRYNRIENITFYGSIDISPDQLFNIFKHYRESYSIKDDLYFYFFNEEKKQGDFILSFFDPSHNRVKVDEPGKNISNITLSWPATSMVFL